MKGKDPAHRRKVSRKEAPSPVGGKTPGKGRRKAQPFQKLFAIDPRSLAVFRITMGLLLLLDLVIRASDLTAMYTDQGMFSRAEMAYRYTSFWNWSFHYASGSWEFQVLLFGLACVLALALAAGFETRLAAIGSWLLLLSLHHRVPPILSGADILFRMLLFWAMFLPLGRVWSLDRWLEEKRGAAPRPPYAPVLSVASAAILLQMGMMYLFSAIFKTNETWFEGGVIAGSLAHDFYAKPLGAWLLRFPFALAVMTWGVFILEWVGPLLLFFPKWMPRLRMAVVAALAAMHLGIALTLEVDLFSPAALAGLCLFLPREFWENRIWKRSPAPAEPAAAPAPRKPSPWRYAAQGACLVALLTVIGINLKTLRGLPPPRGNFFTAGLGLGQKWNMFDQAPSKDGWYVVRARLRDGSEIDLLRDGAPVRWEAPPFPAAAYPNHRWRKIFREMAYKDVLGFQAFRRPVAEYLIRDWNARHPAGKRIEELEFIYCMEPPGGAGNAEKMIRERLLRLDPSGS